MAGSIMRLSNLRQLLVACESMIPRLSGICFQTLVCLSLPFALEHFVSPSAANLHQEGCNRSCRNAKAARLQAQQYELRGHPAVIHLMQLLYVLVSAWLDF